MLRREHAIAEYRNGKIFPDRLTRESHRHYVDLAGRMLRIYQLGVGQTRQQLHRSVWAVFGDEPDCPSRRIEAFCKLLDDRAAYEQDRHGKAAELRRQVFRMATQKHPLVRRTEQLFGTEEQAVKAEIARRLGRTWGEIDRELFADVFEFRRLAGFDGYASAEALLARYNVAQIQAALFGAESMTVWAADDFKTILRYAKLARLMHTITHRGEGRYMLRFDGPASVLRATRRYGAAMARFLPALIACGGWRMHAIIRTRRRGWTVSLDLSDKDGLTSHLPPPEEYDSAVEESFAKKWGSERREGWQLVREGEILHQHQKVFVPDFVFRHDDGRTVLMEIVGFWTPEYLQAKLATLRVFERYHILLAIASSVRETVPELCEGAIFYKSAVRISDVLAELARSGATQSASRRN